MPIEVIRLKKRPITSPVLQLPTNETVLTNGNISTLGQDNPVFKSRILARKKLPAVPSVMFSK